MTARKQEVATKRIEKILRQRLSILADEVAKVEDVRHLPRSVREEIVHQLTDELSEKGLRKDDWEPNTYGIEIEDLIDACGLAWDKDTS